MGNDIGYYFGAYLRIEVTQVEKEYWRRRCPAGHSVQKRIQFCSECGGEAVNEKYKALANATLYDIYDEAEGLGDCIADQTPERMRNAGKYIIVVDNTGQVPSWLSLDHFSHDIETKSFPTDDERDKMEHAFTYEHGEHINEIAKHGAVISVKVETGFLLMLPY